MRSITLAKHALNVGVGEWGVLARPDEVMMIT